MSILTLIIDYNDSTMTLSSVSNASDITAITAAHIQLMKLFIRERDASKKLLRLKKV